MKKFWPLFFICWSTYLSAKVIIIPGLNQKLKAWEPMQTFLSPAHILPMDWKANSKEQLLADWRIHLKNQLETIQENQLKILAHSTGAQLALDLLPLPKTSIKLVFLAPALGLHPLIQQGLEWIDYWPFDELPSFNLKDYRQYDWLDKMNYQALLELQKTNLQKSPLPQTNCQVLLVLAAHDEFIKPQDAVDELKNLLPYCQISTLLNKTKKSSPLSFYPKHLMIDEQGLEGQVMKEIKTFLEN